MYDKLVAKENNIDTSEFVLKTKYDTAKLDSEKEISDADKEISDNIGLAKKRDYNVKISEIIAKIPNIAGLATNTALTAAENKMPDISSLVKKTTTTKKQIITQTYQILKINILLQLITINLLKMLSIIT